VINFRAIMRWGAVLAGSVTATLFCFAPCRKDTDMLRTSTLRQAALAALLTILACAAWRLSMAQDPLKDSPDRQAIGQAATAYIAAFEKGDIDALVAQWAPDAEYIDESGKITQGRAAIAAMLRQNFKNLKGYKLGLQTTAFRFITPDVALADGKATLTSPEGGEERTPYSSVWVKKDGAWKLRSLRDLPDNDEKPSTLADRLKPFTWLLGDWVSKEKNPEIDLTCRWSPGKSFILLDYRVKTGDQTETATQRIGWDPGNEQFRSWYFDSAGGFGEGVWEEGDDHWVGDMTSMLPDGRLGTAKNIIRQVDANSWTFQAHDRLVDGRPLSNMDVIFVRKAVKP
jgi:uncharacterized protein (TIGR02246 family)